MCCNSGPMLKRRPHELSGGQQQRTALARAIAKESTAVFLDEPLANLDYKLREELRDQLPELFAGRGAVVVYATSEPAEALMLGGKTALMNDGYVTQFGPTADIYRHPNTLTSAKVFSDPPINAAAVTIKGATAHLGDGTIWTLKDAAAGLTDGAYTVAIRPNYVTPFKGNESLVKLTGEVLVTELSGSESSAHFRMRTDTWVSLAPGVHPYEIGVDHLFYMESSKCFCFAPDGALVPSEGRILFDDRDVTHLPPDQRNIAQVFQFPVIYDTMTVFDNLAFPLRNRGVDEARVKTRVAEIAAMLDVTEILGQRAAGLTPDTKQKISMGRGLVRDDVNVVMFDEPLTVIDPHLKWKLRSKLKELHHRVRATMIYVTHDQTEALTFADQVVVMQDGQIVQIGTPVELFERPAHTFVGHFIGSPGMNVLPCELRDGAAYVGGQQVALEGPVTPGVGRIELGIRPEFVRLSDKNAPGGLPAVVRKVADLGRHNVVEAMLGKTRVNAIVEGHAPGQGDTVHLAFDPTRTRLYRDGWIATKQGSV